jgi:hypothetical protein
MKGQPGQAGHIALTEEGLTRVLRAAVGGANDTIAQLNSVLPSLGGQIGSQQAILTEANATIARLSAENAELRAASLERDRVLRVIELEREKLRLEDARKGELMMLARQIGGGVMHHLATSQRALGAQSGHCASEANTEGRQPGIKDLGMRLFTSLKPETVAAIRADAGDELLAALLRALMADENTIATNQGE